MGWLINPYRFPSTIPSTVLVFGNRCVGCNNLRKYSLDANLLWSRNTSTTNVFGVAIDNNYNVIAGGNSVSSISTRKYDSNGTLLWSVNHGSTVNSVITDSNNNIYTAGNVSSNITTRKYDPNGNLLWSVNNGATVYSITIDSNDNIYTAGDTFNTLYTIRKYDSNGNLLLSFDTPNGSANKITIDNTNGDIYIATSSSDLLLTNIWKFNNLGSLIWKIQSGGNNAYAIALDSNKNIFIGDSSGNIKKYNSTPTQIWSKNHGGEIRDIKIDSSNNIYATGTVINNITTRKYDNDGNLLWTLNMTPLSYNIAIK